MKMKFAICCIFLFAANMAAAAQHSASLAWSAAGQPAGVNYHVYRAPCNGTITAGVCSSEGTFAIVGSPVGTSYTDSNLAAGTGYAYYVTAFCTAGCPAGVTGESLPSAHVAGKTNSDTPPPPGTPTLTISVLNGLILGEGEVLG